MLRDLPNRPAARRSWAGFTLIELMIALAIVAVLAAVAIPAYQNYTKRSRIANAFVKMADFKARAMEYMVTNGKFPSSEQVLGLGEWFEHNGVDIVSVDMNFGGTNPDPDNVIEIFVEFKPSVHPNGMLSLRGLRNAGGNVVWTCGQTSVDNIPNQYLPKECRR